MYPRRPIALLACFLLAATLAGCASQNARGPIADLVNLPQDAGAFHGLEPDKRLMSESVQEAAYDRFLNAHFSPWNRTTPKYTAKDVFWGLTQYAETRLYGENTLPRSGDWLEGMRVQSRTEAYPSLDRRAIAVTNTSLRVLPTHRPAFFDPERAGEGFPFDYLQNSLVLAGTPLHATHVSADGGWVLVESRFAFGWVPIRDIGWVDDSLVSRFMTGTYVAPTRDGLPVADTDGLFRFTGYVGMLIPAMHTTRDGVVCLIPARTSRGKAVLKAAVLPDDQVAAMPVPPTPANFARLANAMLGEQYGWGGLYENRDCSALLMDLMAPFGLYLPRNSAQQIKIGAFTSLEGMTQEEKTRTILERGTPFLTLLRKPGHIMLYVGKQDDRPVILHAAWGLKTDQDGTEGREIIGKAVITTLTPGIEMPDLARPEGVYLEKISGMTTLPGEEY